MILRFDSVVNSRETLESAISAVLPSDLVHQAFSAVTAINTPDNLEGITGVVVRIKEIFIIENGRKGPFGQRADIYPIVLVANGQSQNPIEFSLPHMFQGIKDREKLPILDPGIAITRTFNSVPNFLDFHVLVMRSKERRREFAKALNETLNSDEGKSIINSVGTLVTGATAGVVLNISSALLQVYLKFLGAEDDEQLFYGVGSFEKELDSLGIGKEHVFTDKKHARVTIEILGLRE
ncbi:hypothetical protein BWI93_25005 [Siphonobacter sp. BAB-5385]|uniref:hypothetical protein n=1 Tax=Siphonobacter sp. BAB-5385 TaxID=1864822 RepID=UPI000B9DFB24|nr:hypothetical protein [Siphonobacter sp. BAB-5385]OZI05527.1 hypothetical protein BWI93_25005 [Siphonobacter sp. BAB-5385]